MIPIAQKTAALALFSRLVLLAALTVCSQAHATIRGLDNTNPANGATELVFLAWDNNGPEPKVAFSKDLGITMDNFFVRGQQDAGSQLFWYLGGTGTGIEGDPVWKEFLDTEVSAGVKVDASKVQWAVFAFDLDQTDGIGDDIKLFTTLRQATSGSATVITGLSTQLSSDFLSKPAPGMNNFIGGMNQQPGHANNDNGSAVVKATQGDIVFPFVNGATPNIGQRFKLDFNESIGAPASNLIGQSSWFYKVSLNEDEFDAGGTVVVDEFDNLGADGYWGLAAASDPARAGQYFLSYTIAAYQSPREQASGLLYGNNFARLGGVLSLSSASGRGTTVLNLANSFVRGIAQARQQAAAAEDGRAFITAASGLADGIDGDRALAVDLTSAVPEPQTWLLFGAGLGLLAWRAGRRAAA